MNFEQIPQQENNENPKEQNILELGSAFHEEWREGRKQEDGSYEPRMKITKDEKWISENGTDQIDIANTLFENLPEDWQKENKVAAEVVMNEIFDAKENDEKINEDFIENASSVVHEEWLKRNGDWAEEEQKKPYIELSEEEKDKDRAQVIKGLEIANKEGIEKVREKLNDVMDYKDLQPVYDTAIENKVPQVVLDKIAREVYERRKGVFSMGAHAIAKDFGF
jgi:hypothetical protein